MSEQMLRKRTDRSSLLAVLSLQLMVAAVPPVVTPRDGAVPTTSQVESTPSGIQFTDVASRLSFSYTSNNNFTGRKYFPQPMCGGIALLDYNNDGRLDIFFTNGAKLPELKKTDSSFYNCLLENKGRGRFEDVTAQAKLTGAELDFCFGVAAGDYDNDGFTDLFVCDAGVNALYHNNGDGTFSNVTREAGLADKPSFLLSVCAAWFDYDNDSRLDLVVSQYTYWDPLTDPPCLRNEKTEVYCSPRTVKPVPHSLYHNEGNGRFRNVTAEAGFAGSLGKGMGIGIADFNQDGLLDIFVANDTEPNFLYVNKGKGKFEESAMVYGVAYNEEAAIVSGMGCDVKDYDNDGWVDILYSNLQTQIFALFRNESGKYFEYVSPAANIEKLSRRFSGWSNAFVDYDNDGWKDIYSSNGDVDYLGDNAAQHDTLWQNRAGKDFQDVSEDVGKDFLRKGYQRGSAIGDLNDDGFPDLVVTSLNEKPRIMLNSGGNGNHWLQIDLRGKNINRDAIGAAVTVVTASGRKLYNHVTTSVGFMSSSDKRLHFGLGQEKEIREIEIRWPGGAVQKLTPISADQVLKAEQP
jgi:enediyne biosynthesis protein E4